MAREEGVVVFGAMGHEFSFVGEAGNGCLIYRETTGRYVVTHRERPKQRRWVATLASAYATCQNFIQHEPVKAPG